MTLVLSASGMLLYLLVHASMFSQFDTGLTEKALSLLRLMEDKDGRIKLKADELRLPEFVRHDRPDFLQVWRDDGTVLHRSPSLGEDDLRQTAVSSTGPTVAAVTLPDGRPGRQAAIRFTSSQERKKKEPKHRKGPPGSPETASAAGKEGPAKHDLSRTEAPIVLVLARDTLDLDATLARFQFLLIVIGAAATLVSAGIMAWVVRRGLLPVNRLATQIEQVGEADLSIRMDLPKAPAEMLPVVQRINDMLERLQAAFAREKSFTSDVAHELRTPLAGLKSIIEVAHSRIRHPEEYREALGDCLAIADQMRTMVNNLLSLARAESGQLKLTRTSVLVAEVFRDCWMPLAERSEQRRLSVSWGLDPEGTVDTDQEQFRLVVGNLLDNAVTYADAGGSIRIESASDNGRLVLRVSNSGSQLSQEQAERVFDRFWRGDAARSATGVHCGLGLALVRKIVTVLGGTIRVESAIGGNFTVHLTVNPHSPRCPGDPDGP
jgi:two-component system sensor histidine kinase QseC